MNELLTSPHLEDVKSVGSRVSWAAIFAGGVLAFAIYFLLMILGSAVGLTLKDRVNTTPLHTAAVVWSLLTFCVALFLGGMITSLFTVGEKKVEAVVYGVLMWALVMGLLIVLGGLGVRSGFNSMMGMAYSYDSTSNSNWEAMARDAGVPADQIDSWRRKTNPTVQQDPADRKAMEEAVTRFTWYAFIGTWVSMLAAGAGALVGAGPTFRIVVVQPIGRVMPG